MNASLSQLMLNERTAIKRYIDQIRFQFPNRILAVTLFGSKARGDSNAESDIDLLVVVDTETHEFRSKLWQIASDVSLKHNVVLSPRVIEQARWNKISDMRVPLSQAVESDGVVLTSESARV